MPDPLKHCSSLGICKAGPILMGFRGDFGVFLEDEVVIWGVWGWHRWGQ